MRFNMLIGFNRSLWYVDGIETRIEGLFQGNNLK